MDAASAEADGLLVRSAVLADKPLLRQLVQLYRYDFSVFDDADIDAHGYYDYPYFDNYWTEPERHPFVFEVGGAAAGFAFVRAGTPHDMAEFFVLRKYRRRHVGGQAVCSLLRQFPGDWQIRQMRSNEAATTFWRSVIPYPFVDSTNDEGLMQLFTVPDP